VELRRGFFSSVSIDDLDRRGFSGSFVRTLDGFDFGLVCDSLFDGFELFLEVWSSVIWKSQTAFGSFDARWSWR
jgi:hypothetical protein